MHINRLALLCAAALCGCAHGNTTSTTSRTVTTESSPGTASADQSQPAPGTGHLNLTGSITLSKDFNVTECKNNGPNAMAFMRGYVSASIAIARNTLATQALQGSDPRASADANAQRGEANAEHHRRNR